MIARKYIVFVTYLDIIETILKFGRILK